MVHAPSCLLLTQSDLLRPETETRVWLDCRDSDHCALSRLPPCLARAATCYVPQLLCKPPLHLFSGSFLQDSCVVDRCYSCASSTHRPTIPEDNFQGWQTTCTLPVPTFSDFDMHIANLPPKHQSLHRAGNDLLPALSTCLACETTMFPNRRPLAAHGAPEEKSRTAQGTSGLPSEDNQEMLSSETSQTS